MRTLIAPALTVGLLQSASAEESTTGLKSQSEPTRQFELSAAYFGEFATHPGGALGLKFSLVNASWYDLSAGPTLGLYVHRRNHVGFFVDADIENRFTAPFGLFGTVGLSAGYVHTWLSGDGVYSRTDDGVVQKTDFGRPHFKPGLSLGFGWDFEKNRLAPLRAFVRLDAFGQTPFNHAILPHAALQVGAVYRFGGAR